MIITSERIVSGLAHVSNTDTLRRWWQTHLCPSIPHDSALIAEGHAEGGAFNIDGVVLHYGEVHENAADLLQKCTKLLNVWSLQEDPCEIELGRCHCVGISRHREDTQLERTFLIHGARTNNRITFCVISGTSWPASEARKALISQIAEPLAKACSRFTQREMLFAQQRRRAPHASKPSNVCKLTPREQQIVTAVAQGLTNKEIARSFGSSPNTVRNQLANLSVKVGARNRAQLALLDDNRSLQSR